MKKVRVILWSMVVIATTVVGGVWIAGGFQNKLPASRTISTAGFAADFELTDYKGMVQTDEDFRGQWMLVFFGFTNCPDVCPMGLSTIAQVLDDLGAVGEALQPVFITVDPARDTPAVLAEYVPQFDTRIIGLSGSAEQIERTGKAFKIYYQRNEDEAAPDGYTMGHTSSFLLFDPNGEFVRIYEYNQKPTEIVSDLQKRLGA
ncbi:protein SCO1/2 [Sulfitobacter undariae]|uniref:Protein SCO1/2 n=1 Tax=Sulfitobacter undariae TaxID=1563671 RepID=A0A7W6EB96_9RHOB|nr:SCO family protein [Sulfitobacter undariae]MBB3995445.1 protein SCO1/2 [Sulfitobacter undariae]